MISRSQTAKGNGGGASSGIRGQYAAIERVVRLTRRRLRLNAVLLGAGLLVSAAAGWLALAIGLDMLLALPTVLRVAACAGLWTVVSTAAAAGVLWPAIRPMSLESVAFRIERALGGMHNRLVTALDLSLGRRTADPAAQPLIERLLRQTNERLMRHETTSGGARCYVFGAYAVRRVASPAPAVRAGLAAAVMVSLLAPALYLSSEYSANAAKRVLFPTRDIPPVARARLDAEPGDILVMQGDSATLRAHARRGEIERATLRLTPDDGDAVRYPMAHEADGAFVFTLNNIEAGHRYRVEGGGTWSESHTIAVLRRPVLERLDVRVRLPGYMRRPDPVRVDAPAEQVSAPSGSTVLVEAAARGDVKRGWIHLFDSGIETRTVTGKTETVWFDDDTPADAVLSGTWRWVSDRSHGGARSHTFGWSREPYGFSTRLNRLELAPDESFYVWILPDPASPPGRVTVTLTDENGREHELVWSAAGRGEGEPDAERRDALPPPGRWSRLEAKRDELSGLGGGDTAYLSGIRFAIDGGRALFDRAGGLRRVVQTSEEKIFTKRESVPMEMMESPGRWAGGFSVESDAHYAVELINRSGHANAPMRPVPVVVTGDRPPTVVVERPGRNLTLDEPGVLPLVVRAFDDYGVAEVLLQVADGPERFGDGVTRVLAAFDEPLTSRAVTAALDPAPHGLSPDRPLYYRLVARDTKGQETAGFAYRLALARPADEADSGPRRLPRWLDGLLDGLGSLLEVPEALLLEAGRRLARLPPGVAARFDADARLLLVDAEGEALTGEAFAAALGEWRGEGMSADDLALWRKTGDELRRRRAELLAVSDRLAEAASAASGSPLAMGVEPAALHQMAERAAALADAARVPDEEDADPTDAQVLERLARLQALNEEQLGEYEQLQRELAELTAARRQLADDPEAARETLDGMMARMRAAGGLQRMRGLETDLGRQHAMLEELRGEVAGLRERIPGADETELDAISARQPEVDERAMAAMRRADELAALGLDSEAAPAPAAPWTPPPRPGESMPQEHDPPGRADGAGARADAADAPDETPWWDRPVDAPPGPRLRAETPERYRDRDPRPVPPAEAARDDAGGRAGDGPQTPGETSPDQHGPTAESPHESGGMMRDDAGGRAGDGPQTPREMLFDHQGRMAESLSERGGMMAGARSRAGRLGDAMQEALDSGDSQAMRSLMESPEMRSAMAAASAMPGRQGSREGSGAGQTGDFHPGGDENGILHGVAPAPAADMAPAVYRLPPALRQPLLLGMRERGPDGYQRLIEAYYRRLSTAMDYEHNGK